MIAFLFLAHTFDAFVVSCDVLVSGETNSFGADEGSHSLCVFADADHPTLAHYEWVDVGVHLGVDKGDVIKQVNASIFDCFDWGWATAEHSWDTRREKRRL